MWLSLCPRPFPGIRLSLRDSHIVSLMASPQLENGYTPIANEILEKICQFQMGGPHFRVVIWIWRFVYGFHSTEILLNKNAIVRGTKMNRSNCYRTIQTLLDNRVLFLDDGNIGFNKNFLFISKFLLIFPYLTNISCRLIRFLVRKHSSFITGSLIH